MKILLAKSYVRALEIIEELGQPLISIEAVYGDKLIKGSSLALDHHTELLSAPPALYAGLTFGLSQENYILVSHVDIDTILGIYLTLYGELLKALKEAVNFIDENGVHMLDQIKDEEAKAFIKAYRGYSYINPCPFDEENITGYVVKLIREIFIDKNHSEYIKIYEEYNNNLRKEALTQLLKSSEKILLFNNEKKLIGLNTLYDLNGFHNYIITYNSHHGSITVSRGIKEGIDLKLLMQKYFGADAGGHNSIAGTPRGMKFQLNDANILFHHLNFLLQNSE